MKTIVLSSTLVLIFASIAGSINDCNDPNFHSLETSETSRLRCGPAFKDLCHCMKTCYDGHHQYVVNCTNAGFYDTSPLAHLPNDTQVRHIDKIKEMRYSLHTWHNTIHFFRLIRCSSLRETNCRNCRGMCSAL